MNRAKSITDIRDIYLEMQRRNSTPTIDESFLYESSHNKTQKVKAKEPKNTFPKSTDTVKEPSSLKKGGPKNVKNLTKPKKNKKFSQKSKKIVERNINNFMSIFDKLYENVMQSDELDIDTGIGTGPEGSFGDTDMDVESDTESTENAGDVTLTLNKDLAKELLDLLQSAVGDDETDSDLKDLGIDSESEDEDENEGYEDEDENESCEDDEDENVKYETTELQKLPDSTGHKLTKAGTVGNIKASSGKADSKVTDEVGTETGKHPLDHKSELTNRAKDKVGNLKTGKNLFD